MTSDKTRPPGPTPTAAPTAAPTAPPTAGRQKRSDRLAARIRELISARGLKPGDRFPQSWLSEQEMRASKGTLREAMKALETQGLIRTRSGPGGGTFVTALSGTQAVGLLRNLFLFDPPDIADIYLLRRQLEPALAAGLAGQLDDKALADLQATVRLYEPAPASAEEAFRQVIAGLDFHSLLAGFSANSLLGFVCLFLHALLRDMTTCRPGLPTPPSQPGDSWAAGSWAGEVAPAYQVRLIRALTAGEGAAAEAIMRRHLEASERFMLDHARIGPAEGAG